MSRAGQRPPRPWPTALALLVVALMGLAVIGWTLTRPLPAPDLPLANDLQRTAADHWPSPTSTDLGHPELSLAVVDAHGRVLLRQHGAPTSELQALRAGANVLPIRVDGAVVGHLHLVDPGRVRAAEERTRTLWWASAGSILLTALIGLVTLARVHRRILRPFADMQRWATRVAHGDLDTPLRMARGETFGAFSESFDLMRTELAASREREAAAAETSRVLIAQLGHDIRTPLASLQAQAELLRLTEVDPTRQGKLDAITAKSAQIDQLLSELFSANRSELASLPITCDEHSSAELVELLRGCDEQLTVPPAPDALLRYDPRRLQQVVDNVLSNAHKYAGTPVTASWHMDEATLRLRLADSGPGAPETDLPSLLARGTRGGNAEGLPGQGLGLHIAATLMERMDGSLTVRNLHPGFAVDLDIALA